jgi:hypothetical protein
VPRRASSASGAALLALPALLGVLLTLAVAPAAHAQGYRYWSFWTRDGGSWTYATQGPATYRPSDGEVLGFRFSVSPDGGDDAARPRSDAGFARICAGTPAKDGEERVALVLDFGTAADAPDGETPLQRRTACARIDQDATAADALAAEAEPLRYNSVALLCAIDGYPATGCGERVSGDGHTGSTPADAASHTAAAGVHAGDGDGSGTSTTLSFAVGAVLVAALGAGAVLQTRRRRG